jgi:hypothetical protein
MKWIKCSDEMPPKGKVVLLRWKYPAETIFNCRADPLCRAKYHICMGGLNYKNEFIDYHEQYGSALKYVSHWCEMPDDPEVE